MAFLHWGRKLFVSMALVLMVTVGLGVCQPLRAIAASLPFTPTLADTVLERRASATADKVGGQIQEAYGDVVDSPANQAEGRAKRLSGEVRNRAEDARDTARDTARAAQEEGDNLIDRVKDFFDADDNTAMDATGSRRTGRY